MLTKRKSKQLRQEEIKSAVLEIISNEELNGLSTRKLAEYVGISEGAIFKHFKSKKEIMYGIMDDVKTDLQDKLRKIALSAKPAKEKLFEFIEYHITYLQERKGITILLFSEAAHMNDIRMKLQLNEILTEQKMLIGKIIHDGQEEGIWDKELKEDSVAMLYLGIPLSFNVESVLNNNGVDVKDFIERMFCIFSKALTNNNSECK
jgi:AcrR family transcriptional regulator